MLTDAVNRLDAWKLEKIADKRPTDYIYALMSNHVYNDVKTDEALVKEGNERFWKACHVHKGTSGYFGVIYVNHKENHIVVAHRGTNTIKALIEDLHGIFLNRISPQKKEAFELVTQAVKIAKERGCSLSFTGHSLGAFLAELSVFYCKSSLDFHNVNAVTFESPGSRDSLEKLQSNLHPIDLNDLDIISYVSCPNLINTCNYHIGTMYTVDSYLGEYGQLPGWHLKQAHSMNGIIVQFAGKARLDKLACLQDWPMGTQREHFFKLAQIENGVYALPSEEELIASGKQHFELSYEAHYKINISLSCHNVLPLKHFSLEMQKFLIAFYTWQTANSDEKEQKLKDVEVPEDVINYLLNYKLIKYNHVLVVKLNDIQKDITVFRRELSAALEKQGNKIKILIETQLSAAKLEIIAAIVASGGKLLQGGVIEEAKVTGLEIDIPENTPTENIVAANQMLEQIQRGTGKIEVSVIAPGAEISGSIRNSTVTGAGIRIVKSPEPITPSYDKKGTAADSSSSSREEFFEEKTSRKKGRSPSPSLM